MLSSIKSREDPQIVMLYISPQSLARPELQQCLDGLISRQVLSVVGIDEIKFDSLLHLGFLHTLHSSGVQNSPIHLLSRPPLSSLRR